MSEENTENPSPPNEPESQDSVAPSEEVPEVDEAAAAALKAAQEAVAAMQDDAMPSTESDEQALESAASTASEAIEDVASLSGESASGDTQADAASPFTLETFQGPDSSEAEGTLSLLDNVNLDVKIELGRTRMFVEDVLKLSDGAVIELDKLAGDPVDIFVNSRHVARGEVLVLNDNFCVRISEILDPSVHDKV